MTTRLSRTEQNVRSYSANVASFVNRNRDRSPILGDLDSFASLVPDGGLVLDLGCGPGFETAALQERGQFAVGVDLTQAMLQAASERYNGHFVCADMCALPFTPGVDGIWACASMLHLERDDFAAALSQFRDMLIPGGVICLSVKEGEGAGWDEHMGAEWPRWFTYWTETGLDAVLAESGFEVIGGRRSEGPRATWLRRTAVAAHS